MAVVTGKKDMKSRPGSEKLTAIDLFSGCGGMTYGLRRSGFRVIAALEIDPIASATYTLNHPETRMKRADIRGVDASAWMSQLKIKPGELDLLAGCPPCQGFSRLRTKNGNEPNRDPKNRLILEMGRMVDAFRPKTVMVENVPGLRDKTVFKEFVRFLRAHGYTPSWKILDASKFGVPQRRKRLVLLAGRGFPIEFGQECTATKTVRTTIGSLPSAGTSGDPLHDMPEHRSRAMEEWIAAVPKDGGSRSDLPATMQRKCHSRSDGFKDVYGRMAWDEIAPTITGGCFNPSKGRYLHPEENRNITIREAALLQTFPKSFRVPGGTTKVAAAMMIGNALPPEFVRRQGKAIKKAIEAVTRKEPQYDKNENRKTSP